MNDLRFRILSRKLGTLKCLNFMASNQPGTQKANLTFALNSREKSAVKHSMEKTILLNFVNLS